MASDLSYSTLKAILTYDYSRDRAARAAHRFTPALPPAQPGSGRWRLPLVADAARRWRQRAQPAAGGRAAGRRPHTGAVGAGAAGVWAGWLRLLSGRFLDGQACFQPGPAA